MQIAIRSLKLFTLVLAGAASAGCCVLPPFGHRHGGHYQNYGDHGQSPYPGAPPYQPRR